MRNLAAAYEILSCQFWITVQQLKLLDNELAVLAGFNTHGRVDKFRFRVRFVGEIHPLLWEVATSGYMERLELL